MATGSTTAPNWRDAISRLRQAPRRLLIHITQLDPTRPMAARLSIGVGRIAIFSAMLWVYFIIREAMAGGDVEAYARGIETVPFYRFGLLRLWIPTPEVWALINKAALISLSLAIIGLFTRPAMIVAVISTTMLATLDAGRLAFWSAPYNVVFLAGIAFMFGRADVSLSLDSLLARRFSGYPAGRIAPEREFTLAWPVLLAQAATALFYFGAFVTKLVNGGYWFIFSDNLRNALAITWTAPKEFVIPWFVELIWSHPVLWIGALLAHLVMQAIPATAIFLPRRPWVRLVEGLIFAGGVVALRELMTVWNPWWIPLGVLFVDWDHFFGRADAPTQGRAGRVPLWPMIFAAVFLGYYLLQIFGQRGRLDLAYPFDNFDMYSGIYAARPYNEHKPYVLPYGDVTIRTSECGFDTGRWVDITNKSRDELKALYSPISRKSTIYEPLFYRCVKGESRIPQLPDNYFLYGADEVSIDDYRKRLEALRLFFEPMPPGAELRLWGRFMIYPAYPDSPMPFDAHRGLRGLLRGDGSYAAAKATLTREPDGRPSFTIQQSGLEGAVWRVRFRHAHWIGRAEELSDLPGSWMGDRYIYEAAAGPKPYSIVLVTNDPKTGEELQFYGPHIYN